MNPIPTNNHPQQQQLQQQSNSVFLNGPQHIDNQFSQPVVLSACSQIRAENDSLNFLTDQLDLSLTDMFRTLNGSQMAHNSLLNNFTHFANISTNMKPQTIVLNTSSIKTEQSASNANLQTNIKKNTNVNKQKKVRAFNFKKFLTIFLDCLSVFSVACQCVTIYGLFFCFLRLFFGTLFWKVYLMF